MKLTVLTDDNSSENTLLQTEHGLCFYIEIDEKKILLDTGQSDVFMKNAKELGINLFDLDYIVFSHGHYDHTWGIAPYLRFLQMEIKKDEKIKKPIIITHPDTFLEKFQENLGEIGCLVTEEKLRKTFKLELSEKPYKITENLIFLGGIPKENDFEGKEPIKKVLKNGVYEDDYVEEDSALAYKTNQGLVIITGCSHSGICNIVEYSKKVLNEDRILSVIGGFHLISASEDKMNKIVKYFQKQDIKYLYPCHCTGLVAKHFMQQFLNVKNINVGTEIIY